MTDTTTPPVDVQAVCMAAVKAAENDGHPFGCPPGHSIAGYMVRVADDGSACLHQVHSDGTTTSAAHSPAFAWRVISEAAEADFNPRLEAKGVAPGKMPAKGGKVGMHQCFGRELMILMMSASIDFQTRDVMIGFWQESTPKERFVIWNDLVTCAMGETLIQNALSVIIQKARTERWKAQDAKGKLARMKPPSGIALVRKGHETRHIGFDELPGAQPIAA